MSERDELYELIEGTFDDLPRVYEALTDAVLTAGYRKPQQATTIEELVALPLYSVVLDADAIAYQHYGSWEANGKRIQWSAEGRWFDTEQITLPATVLHVGEAK